MSGRPAINRKPDRCPRCGEHVAPGEGYLISTVGRGWRPPKDLDSEGREVRFTKARAVHKECYGPLPAERAEDYGFTVESATN